MILKMINAGEVVEKKAIVNIVIVYANWCNYYGE